MPPDAPEPAAEEKIFEAARAVFTERGYDGARMQEIADRAGINKALLHYYYRSKDRLFELVFRAIVEQVVPRVSALLDDQRPLLERIDRFVELYIDLVLQHPFAPQFIIRELSLHPGRLVALLGPRVQAVFAGWKQALAAAVARGEVRPIPPEHLFANLIGLCVFPFVARPLLQTAFDVDDAVYRAFLESRKREVRAFLRAALEP